jgi:hypothetical protein
MKRGAFTLLIKSSPLQDSHLSKRRLIDIWRRAKVRNIATEHWRDGAASDSRLRNGIVSGGVVCIRHLGVEIPFR